MDQNKVDHQLDWQWSNDLPPPRVRKLVMSGRLLSPVLADLALEVLGPCRELGLSLGAGGATQCIEVH